MIDFDIAKTWHKMFTEHLLLIGAGMISEAESRSQVCNDRVCKLGQWLYGPGKLQLEAMPLYVRLMKMHEHFYDVACHYLSITQREGDERSKADVEEELVLASAGVTTLIDMLQMDVASKSYLTTKATQTSGTSDQTDTFVWDDSLSIGIPAIDEHHRSILLLVAKLMKNPDASLQSEGAVDNLTELGKILGLHFAVEEAYMRQFGMPVGEYESHKNKHSEILQQYADLNISSYENRHLKVGEISSQIRAWAIDHVIEYDHTIKPYTNPAQSHLQG